MTQEPKRRPDFGLDAPGLLKAFLGSALAATALAVLAFLFVPEIWGYIAGWGFAIIAAYFWGMGGLMFTWSRAIKLRQRDRLLSMIPWTGNETVLDVGCGRGLMLIGAAGHLTTGRATGIDLWIAKDQSGNRPESTRENAQRAGVAERIDIVTGDMRSLPFPDANFDVVTSYWAIHNLESADDRTRAIREIVRVLKPGGSVILADIQFVDSYRTQLSEANFADFREPGSKWIRWFLTAISGGSFRPRLLVGRKT